MNYSGNKVRSAYFSLQLRGKPRAVGGDFLIVVVAVVVVVVVVVFHFQT